MDRINTNHHRVSFLDLILLALQTFNFDIFGALSARQSRWRMQTKTFMENLIQVFVIDELVMNYFSVLVENIFDFISKLVLDGLVVGKLYVLKIIRSRAELHL